MIQVGAEHGPIVRESDSLVAELVLPPGVRGDVCSSCRTWADQELGQCYNCTQVENALGHPALHLTVLSLYQKPSLLRDWLTRYKGRLSDEDEPHVPDYERVVRLLLGRFLIERSSDLLSLFGEIDGLVVVPSTSRPPPHPLASILESLELDVPVLDLLERGPGDLRFQHPDRAGYVIKNRALDDARVLLVDDVYTTGARVNSAAYALRDAGISVVGALAIARRVNPGWRREVAEFWQVQASLDYRWDAVPL